MDKKNLIQTLSTGLLKTRSTLQNGQKNEEDQYPKIIFNLDYQYLLLLEDQYHF